MALTRQQSDALCSKVKAKAAEFARYPEKGFAAGYRPEQARMRPEDGPALELGPRVPTRGAEVAWLYGVARRDLALHRWQILEDPDEVDLVVI